MDDFCIRCWEMHKRLISAVHSHHVRAKGIGGSKILEAGRTIRLCLECHLWVHANPRLALEQGYRELRNVS